MKFSIWLEEQEERLPIKLIAFTACVLYKNSQNKLIDAAKKYFLERTGKSIPAQWSGKAHHMTVKWKPQQSDLENKWFGEDVSLLVDKIAIDDYAVAVLVRPVPGLDTSPRIPHITVAHSRDVGAVYSNTLIVDASKISNINPLRLESKFLALSHNQLESWPKTDMSIMASPEFKV